MALVCGCLGRPHKWGYDGLAQGRYTDCSSPSILFETSITLRVSKSGVSAQQDIILLAGFDHRLGTGLDHPVMHEILALQLRRNASNFIVSFYSYIL